MHSDVPAHHLRQLAAAIGTGEPEEQNCRIAAFEDLVGPALTPFPRGRDEQLDVVDQQRVSRGAGSVPGCGVLAPYPRQVAVTSS